MTPAHPDRRIERLTFTAAPFDLGSELVLIPGDKVGTLVSHEHGTATTADDVLGHTSKRVEATGEQDHQVWPDGMCHSVVETEITLSPGRLHRPGELELDVVAGKEGETFRERLLDLAAVPKRLMAHRDSETQPSLPLGSDLRAGFRSTADQTVGREHIGCNLENIGQGIGKVIEKRRNHRLRIEADPFPFVGIGRDIEFKKPCGLACSC